MNLTELPNRHHVYSIERLYHFRCGYCNKWWTIGDWTKTTAITCPLCGKTSFVEEIKND